MIRTKLSYPTSIAFIMAIIGMLVLTHPESAPQRSIWLMLVPVAALTVF